MRALKQILNAADPWQQSGPIPVPMRLRPPLFHPKLPFIVFWSEKAGCTAVVKWFLAQAGLLEHALREDPWVHNFRVKHYSRNHRYMKAVSEALSSGEYTAIKVIRDPLRRAVSSFLVLAEKGARAPGYHWVQDYEKDIAHWLAKRGRDPHAGVNFVEHLTIVDEAIRAGRFVDSHLLPQHLPREEEVVRELIPIEEFAAWCSAQAAAGLVKPVDEATTARSGHHHAADPSRTADLGERPEEARITPALYADNRFPDPRAFLAPAAMPLLRSIYGGDLDAYSAHYPVPPHLAAADPGSQPGDAWHLTP